ncbi:MAG: MFS transporter [Planctomycetales bacterium]
METPRPRLDSSARRPTWFRYVVLGGLCLAAALAYVPRNSISVVESTIRDELGLTKDDTRWIITGFFLTYAFLQIPSGQVGHHWGTRRSLPLFSVLNSLATLLFSVAPGLVLLIATRMIMGVAQAGYFPCSTITIGKWFAKRQQAFASGMLASAMSIGAGLGTFITGYLLLDIGWRSIFAWYAVPGLLWAAWFHWMFRDWPRGHPSVNEAELALIRQGQPPGEGESDAADPTDSPPRRGPDESRSTPWSRLAASPALWAICAQQFCRAAGYMFYGSWFATFLQESRGVSIAESGLLNSLPIIATVLGGPAGGWFSDWLLARTGNPRLARQGIAAASMLGCAGLIFAAYGVRDARLAVLLISAGAYCAAFGGPISYTITIDMGGKHVAPVFSTMNMVGNIGALSFPIIVPELLRWSDNDWNSVMALFGGLYLLAALFWLMLNPRGDVLDQSLLKD